MSMKKLSLDPIPGGNSSAGSEIIYFLQEIIFEALATT